MIKNTVYKAKIEALPITEPSKFIMWNFSAFILILHTLKIHIIPIRYAKLSNKLVQRLLHILGVVIKELKSA